MEIAYLDIFYKINRDVHQILMVSLQKEIPAIDVIDDLSAFEVYEIMRMPVIQLVNGSPQKPKQPLIRLKVFCCSCVRGCIFLNLFTGENWQF
jgi:hypothetical protein